MSHFNLPDLRGQFVRGLDNVRTLGSIQNWSTGMPKNKFITNTTGNHNHNINKSWNTTGNSPIYGVTYQSEAGSDYTTTTAGNHSHIISGGDSETRPDNIALNYIMKI